MQKSIMPFFTFTVNTYYCLSLVGAATSIIFVSTKQTRVCRDKTRLLSRLNYAFREEKKKKKKKMVATKLCLSRQILFCVCRNKSFVASSIHLSRQETCFVATRDVFCRDKHVFVAPKLIHVTAPANDNCRAARTKICQSCVCSCWASSHLLANGSDKYQLCPGEWLRQVPIMSWRMAQTSTNYFLAKYSAKYQICPGEGLRQVLIMFWRRIRQVPIMSWRRTQTSTNYVLKNGSDKYQLCPGEWLRQIPIMSWWAAQARAILSIQQFLSFTMGSDNGLDKS